MLLTPARFHIDCNEYFDGGPDAVVEIHSPDDEAYEKLAFYASVGVQEVWIIDRDTKEPEIFKLVGGDYEHGDPNAEGRLRSGLANIEFRSTGGDKLEIRIAGRGETVAQLP